MTRSASSPGACGCSHPHPAGLMTRRQLHLNTFINAVGHHEAAWRLAEAVPNWNLDIEHYKNLARIAERGLLDSIFFADIQGLISSPSRRPGEMLDPVVKLTALAGARSSAKARRRRRTPSWSTC